MNESGDPALTPIYINRELSWLSFNRRVLQEAANPDNPPLEQLKFLSISASNLDEFFMVRFASLRASALAGNKTPDPCGLSPHEQLQLIAMDAQSFAAEQATVFHEHILPALAQAGLSLLSMREASAAQARWAEQCFAREILPKLSLTICEKSKPLPSIRSRLLHMGLFLLGEKKDEPIFATTPLPPSLPRTFRIPAALGEGILLLEDIVTAFAGQLAPGRRVTECWPYRVTRDADFTVPEDAHTDDLLIETKKSLSKRMTGDVVRLEVEASTPEDFVHVLRKLFSVPGNSVMTPRCPLNLTFLLKELYATEGLDALRYPSFKGHIPARLAEGKALFAALRAEDVFLHHPYDSFDAVLRFVRDAAADPRVLAIKQTLYRVSGNSPVIKALCDAAEAGKRVTVLLELKARFDEENNIRWGEVLERAGCDVIYGLPRVKTHSKITLVVRREGDGLKRYVHLGTGNYNDVTARLYTDMGLITADEALGVDAQAFFNMITGFSREPAMRKLIYAPKMLRSALAELIGRETANARAGLPSGITAKMNSLVDSKVIDLLYEASQAGVPIRLIVRGICSLRAGVPGLSENIAVHSIVGRFLEHSRAFRFENGGNPQIFLSSADWMPRNLNRRVELMFPVENPVARERIERVLDLQWRDTVKAWQMMPDGTYNRVPRAWDAVNAQEALLEGGGTSGGAAPWTPA